MSSFPVGSHFSAPQPSRRATTATQRSIWFNESLDDCRAAHHVPFAVRFSGPLDTAALRDACLRVIHRHPALSSVVEDQEGVPILVSGRALPDLAAFGPHDAPLDADAERAFVQAPFDLNGGPLFRMRLHAAGPDRHRLLVVVHHLVFDGRAMEIFLEDLAGFYAAAVDGRDPGLPDLEPVDTAGPENERIVERLPAARAYWEKQPLGATDVVLPWLERSVSGARDGGAVEFALPEELRARLAPAARQMDVTLFELLVASLHALLFRYGNQTPVTALDLSTRTPDLGGDFGPYVNEPPFSSEPEPDMPFGAFARSVRTGLRELYQVRSVPLGRVGLPLAPGIALAQVSLSYRRAGAVPVFPGVRVAVDWVLSNDTSRNALRIEMVDAPDRFGVLVLYPEPEWQREGAEQMTRHWLGLLQHVVSAPDTALAELPVPDGEEHARILTHGKGRTAAYPVRTVVDLVAEQVSRAPDAVAVTYGERSLTYAELWRDAGRTAHRLRARGVGPGSLVALRAQRSERLVVGLLGVLRAGAAYLPLDPHYPQGRLEFVRADSGAADELTDTELAPEATAAGDLRDAVGPEGTALDNAPPSTDKSRDGGAASAPAPGDLAYVIYTSGSTGRPKGVQVEHRSLANLLLSMRDLLDSGPGHTWLALTSVSFDIAHLEVFLPLVTGGTLVVAADEHVRDGKALGELVARHAVTHVQATPTSWAMLLDAGFHAPSVVALTGGEALPLPLAQRLRPEVARLLNVYGPTETTIWSACDDIAVDTERVTIGRPLAGELLHVLDRRLSSTLAGIPGDLYIAGSGLARGYLGRPDLDAERFVANPFGPAGSRMYRTGDRAVHRPDGRLEFLGRTDEQIKLRGYRIELGEIEARMLAVSGVVQAAAVVREGRLIGYFAGRPGEGTVRRELAGELPAYMVPDLLVALDALPVTPNGKLDRKALLAPPDPAALEAEAADAPLEAVRGIWCEVLGVPQVDDSEDLFDLGGHSITMTQISARIWDRLGADVPLHAYFDDPTVRGIAAVVAEQLRTQC